jgi:hypothetical protein
MSNSHEPGLPSRFTVNRQGLWPCPNNPPNEFMRVSLRKPDRFVEDFDVAIFIDSPDKPDLAATERQRVLQPNPLGQTAQTGTKQRRFSLADQPAFQVGVVGVLERLRLCPQLLERSEAIPLPDLLLPQPIVPLDDRVGGGPPLGGKDWNDPAGQTEPDQLPEGPGMLPASRQTHVVVHLQKFRRPVPLPVRREKGQNAMGAAIRFLASGHQTRGAVLAVDNDNRPPRCQIVSHDKVHLMNVVLLSGRRSRQNGSSPRPIPTFSRQQPVSNQDAMDRPEAVQGADGQIDELLIDRFGAAEPQRIASALELAMDLNHQTLEGRTDPSSQDMGTMRPVLIPQRSAQFVPPCPPIHPRAAAPQRTGNPTNGLFLQPQADASLSRFDRSRSFFDSYHLPSLSNRGIIS